MKTQFHDEEFKKASACSHCKTCVVVASKEGKVAVRDSKDSTLTTLVFDKEEWQAFLDGVKKGEFDFSD